jgi:hypothetical protein
MEKVLREGEGLGTPVMACPVHLLQLAAAHRYLHNKSVNCENKRKIMTKATLKELFRMEAIKEGFLPDPAAGWPWASGMKG